MTESDPQAELETLASDYLDAWQRHLSEMARDAELPAVIGRLYARSATDPAAVVEGFNSWNDAWRAMISQLPGGDPFGAAPSATTSDRDAPSEQGPKDE